MFYGIKKPKEIPEAFTDCIGGVLSVVAKEIRIGVTPAPGVTVEAMLTKFPITSSDVGKLESPTILMKRGEAAKQLQKSLLAQYKARNSLIFAMKMQADMERMEERNRRKSTSQIKGQCKCENV